MNYVSYKTKYRICAVGQVICLFAAVLGVLLLMGAGWAIAGGAPKTVLIVPAATLVVAVAAGLVISLLATWYKSKIKTYEQSADSLAVETLAKLGSQENDRRRQ